jgi:hypothetical protein
MNDAIIALSSPQSIPDNSTTIINWDGVSVVGLSNASGTFTVPAGGGGVYLFTGVVSFAANATGVRYAYIYKGAANQIQFFVINPGAGSPAEIAINFMLTLAAADTFSIRLYQNSGGALDTRTGTECKMRIRQMA